MGNRLSYDIEIKKAICGRGETRLDGIEYVEGGWSNHSDMGISVLCAWDSTAKMPLVFCDDNIHDFPIVAERFDYICSFNGVNFDRKVLAANGLEYDPAKDYDVLRELWIADGLDPDRFNPRTHGGYGLDNCASVNFGMNKTGNGAEAPIWYQRGQYGNLITYCMRDVMLTARLVSDIEARGGIRHPKTGDFVAVRKPGEDYDQFIARRADAIF